MPCFCDSTNARKSSEQLATETESVGLNDSINAQDSEVKNIPDSLNAYELRQWYKQGVKKMEGHLQLEHILKKLNNLDIYTRELKRLNLNEIEVIKDHRENIIDLDSEEFEVIDDEPDSIGDAKQCEHVECH